MKKRNWKKARIKVEEEGRCRFCGKKPAELARTGLRLEAVHLVPRQWDQADDDDGILIVDPLSIVPACGPATDTRSCHSRFDCGELEALPALSFPEQAAVVKKVGLLSAYTRLTSRYVSGKARQS